MIAGLRTELRHHHGTEVAAVLDAAGPSAARQVQRGRGLARRGAVEDLKLAPGRITAVVVEDRSAPEHVEILWPQADDQRWEAAVPHLAASLRSLAELLEGRLGPAVTAALGRAGIHLLARTGDHRISCTCDQSGPWCTHAAAVLTLTAVQVDREETLLLLLAGRSREQLLAALRGSDDRLGEVSEGVDLGGDVSVARGDLDAIEVHPSPVQDPGALLRQLGDPPGVDDPELLTELIARAAGMAWRLAAGDGAEAADEEALLAELRARRVATAAALAEALGRDEVTVTAALEELFARGDVLRTGSGERTRYRAAST